MMLTSQGCKWTTGFVFAVALALGASNPVYAQDYSISGTGSTGFTSISTTGTNRTALFGGGNFGTQDDGFQDIAIPFDFEFYGTNFPSGSTVRVFADGYMQFNSADTFSSGTVQDLATGGATPNEAIFLCWDDLDFSIAGSLYQETRMGTAGMEWVLEFSGVSAFNFSFTPLGSYDVQVVLFENTNNIEIRYGSTFMNDTEYSPGGVRNAGGTLVSALPDAAPQTALPTTNILIEPATGAADLRAANLTVSAGQALVGDQITLNFGLDNVGVLNSPSFDYGIYLSLDATIDTNDQLIASMTGLQFDAGMGAPQSVQVTIPTPNPTSMMGRTYFIGVLADNGEVVTELNETNNQTSASLLIGPDFYRVITEPQTSFSTILGQSGTTEIASSAVNPADDGEVGITTPFAFRYFGVDIPAGTDVAVGYNGYIEIGDALPAASSNFSNTSLPTSNTSTTSPNDNVICLFWDDLNVSSAGTATIAQRVEGTAGSQIWTIEFNMLSRTGASTPGYTGQIVIEEGTNVVRLRYDPNLPFAGTASATIGMEGANNVEFIELSAATGSPSANARPTTNFVFLENQNVNNTIDLTVSSVTASASQFNIGSSGSVDFTLENLGSSDSGAFEYTVVFSTDNRFDLSDTVLDSDTVMNLAAGNTMMLSQALPLPQSLTPGTYFVGVLVNSSAAPVMEFEYFNNTSFTSAITIDPPGAAEGDVNDDDVIDVGDVMFCVNIAIDANPTNMAADLNNDMMVNVQDVQIAVNRVINAP